MRNLLVTLESEWFEACCDHATKRQGIGYADAAASDASIFVKLGTFACLMGGFLIDTAYVYVE